VYSKRKMKTENTDRKEEARFALLHDKNRSP